VKLWRQNNPQLGLLRLFANKFDIFDKDLSEYLLDAEELSRGILVDDDIGFWLRNFGRFIPALKCRDGANPHGEKGVPFPPPSISDDWEHGLMGRILPSLLQMKACIEIPADIAEERVKALAVAKEMFEKRKYQRELLLERVIRALSPCDYNSNVAAADRVWFNTKAAFPGVSMEDIIETVDKHPSLIVGRNPYAKLIWD
jgi:hypothetical protein